MRPLRGWRGWGQRQRYGNRVSRGGPHSEGSRHAPCADDARHPAAVWWKVIWLAYLAAALVLAALADDAARRWSLIGIGAGFVGVWVCGFLPEPALWFAAALMPILAGVAIVIFAQLPVPAILLLVSGIAVIPARLSGQDFEFGQPLLVASDLLGCAAIFALGFPGLRASILRTANMGGNLGWGSRGVRASRSKAQKP